MIRRLALIASSVILIILVVAAAAAYWLFSGDGVRRALENQAGAWLGQPVRIGSASGRLFPRLSIHLSDVRVGDPARLTLASVDVSAPLRALLHRRIEDADIAVARSRIEMPLPFAIPDAAGRQDAAAPSASSPSVRLVSVRSIALRDVTVVSRGRALTVSSDASFRGEDAGAVLTLTRLSAVSGATSLDASGQIALQPRVDAQLRVTANRLDLDDLIALANAFAPAPGAARGTGTPVRIAARISAETARIAGIDARNFACNLQATGTDVSLSPMSVTLFGGRYEGSLSIRARETLSATLRSRVTDLDVGQLAAFGGADGAITGKLSGAGSFSGTGRDFAGILSSAHGQGSGTIVDGSIAHLDLVRTVVIFFGRPGADSPAATDHFDRLDVQFSLADQVLRADALALHSRDADLVGQGTLSTTTKTLDGRVDVSLSEALSKEAGTDLYRYTREGNRIVLPATVAGNLGAPRIRIDAAAAVQRGLRNELQERLGGLLNRFSRDSTP